MGLTLEAAEPAAVEIWAEHLPAWEAWCAISGQWRTAPLSTMEQAKVIFLGLDYAAARHGLDLAEVRVSPEIWDDVRSIEAGAIEELNRG
ncbi:DUF1799 domain-containing protein [Paracoccus sp. IB05]|uniref:DUF1799 domain-containing protein n=1 Tax=Paracoccus sp. IB05 TaxID=2779367 RepID=UPI0018E753D5|nr:DUF1799 domain-containing protein [Paracoccus sp. IB05]MBJ2150603.1 DUF1799 domain-containing protein [Paracoccus sp. IB05]